MNAASSWLLFAGLYGLAVWAILGGLRLGTRPYPPQPVDEPVDLWPEDVELHMVEALNVVDLADYNERHRLQRVHLADQIEASMARHPSGSRPGHVTYGYDFGDAS